MKNSFYIMNFYFQTYNDHFELVQDLRDIYKESYKKYLEKLKQKVSSDD